MPETALPVTEDEKIETAVNTINDIIATKVYDGAVQVGNYLLETFFDNDPELAASKNPYKSSSYRNLCSHPNLAVARTTLNNMVKVAMQERFLIDNGIETDKLKYSYKVQLLRLENDTGKLKFAIACIEMGMSFEKLKSGITSVKEMKAGYLAPTQKIQKYINRVGRWLDNAALSDLISDHTILNGLEPAQMEVCIERKEGILEQMAVMQSNLTGFVDYLRKRRDPGDDPG